MRYAKHVGMDRSTRFFILAFLLLSGCGNERVARISAVLQPVATCHQAEQLIKQAAIAEMNERLDLNYQAAVSADGSPCWELVDGPQLSGGGTPRSAPNQRSPDTVSGTNNQVADVDEADFVKSTDDGHLFVVSDGKLRIVDAWPAAEAHVLATAAIEGKPKKMFVRGNRVLVYSSLSSGQPASEFAYYWEPRECTYGYQCDFTGDGHPTKLTIFDVTDLTHPIVQREIWLSGSLLAARRMGNAVYTVVSDNAPEFEGVTYWPDALPYCQSVHPLVAQRAFSALRAENEAIIEATDLADGFPKGVDSVQGDIASEDCSNFRATETLDGGAFTSVLAFDLQADNKTSITTVISRPGAVYVSPDALYMSVPHEQRGGYRFYGVDEAQASTVHKFKVDANLPEATYRASGVVKGRVLNQFAMDEHRDHLRIATTSGWTPDPSVHSTLTVLREEGTQLVPRGVVDNIAPTEDIRSVRFSGDRGFIVTFKKTDPLFAFDLSDPADPNIQGELKIPGFSTYMHMMDDDHLLTIGYDADDQGDFAWFTGVMLQIFDVSDMSNPTLTHKQVIGTRGSSSEALTNHLAFTYFPAKQALALPMTICEGRSGGGRYGQNMTFSGLMVFNTTVDKGFAELGRVDHPPGQDVDCRNWWTRANSQVKRSFFMDDYVFSVSERLVKANHLGDLNTDVATISIADH